MFVGNLKIEGTDSLNPQLPGIAGQPEKTMVPSATWDPKKEFVRNESGYEMLEMSLPTMIIICSAIFVVMAVSIVLIWTVKKKKPAEQ